jgi:hypothetical protein
VLQVEARWGILAALSEDAKQVAHQQDHQHGSEANTAASAIAPAVVTKISAAQAKNQHQNDNEYKHFRLLLLQVKKRRYATALISPGVVTSTSSSKSERYSIIAVRRSSVLTSSRPRGTATACAER